MRRSYSKLILRFFACTQLLIFLANCGTPAPKKELTITEQIEVDTRSAEGLSKQFKEQVNFTDQANAERFLKRMVEKLVAKREGFKAEKVEVKIHDDSGNPDLKYLFAFPGMTLSVPQSFLKKVQFENELAAGLALEVAEVINRTLAMKVEKDETLGIKPVIFGQPSVFDLTREERTLSIKLATALLIEANYDIRGVASIFTRYPTYYVRESASEKFQKEVAFNLREARRAKSEYLPQIDPVVRSSEFIQLKKELLHVKP
jgi:hypothetical protein